MKFISLFGRRIAVAMASILTVVASVTGAAAQTARVGDTFNASTEDGKIHRFSGVAYDAPNNAYLVVWGVVPVGARFVSADGVPLGGPVQVNTSAPARQAAAVRVACGAEINACLVVWNEETPFQVMGRLLRYNGGAVQFLGLPFEIATSSTDNRFAPGVAYSPASQEFLVAWGEYGSFDVLARRVTGSGVPTGDVFVAASSATAYLLGPSVAYNSAQNEYLVAFYIEAGSASGVAAQRVQAGTGSPIGTWNTIYASIFDKYPEIAYNPQTNQYLAVTWSYAGTSWMLHGGLADGNGVPIGGSLSLALHGGGDGIGVTYNPLTGTYFAVYLSGVSDEIWGVEVNAAGVPGQQIQVTVSGTSLATQPQAAPDGLRKRFLTVASQNFRYVMGQLVQSGGSTAGPPPTPVPISPHGTIVTATPTYSWRASTGATDYQLWVNDSSGTKSQSWYHESALGCMGGTGTCSLTPAVPLAVGNATWWVKAWNKSGGASAFSAGLPFTRLPPVPGAPVLLSPYASIASNTPPFKWNAAANATMYYLWVRDGTGPRVQTWYNAASICSGGTCSVNPRTPLAGTGIWWVQGWNAEGGYGPWSAPLGFTITTPLPLNPSGNHGTTTPAYRWTAIPGATHYQIFVRDSTGVRLQTWYTADAACASGTCIAQPGITLVKGDGIWWVQPWGPDGYGNWSIGTWFRTGALSQSTLIGPAGAVTTMPVQFSWYAAGGASHYYLWVTDSKGVRVQQWYYAGDLGCLAGGTCGVALSPSLNAGTGTWWVQPWAEPAGLGPWSAGLNFVR